MLTASNHGRVWKSEGYGPNKCRNMNSVNMRARKGTQYPDEAKKVVICWMDSTARRGRTKIKAGEDERNYTVYLPGMPRKPFRGGSGASGGCCCPIPVNSCGNSAGLKPAPPGIGPSSSGDVPPAASPTSGPPNLDRDPEKREGTAGGLAPSGDRPSKLARSSSESLLIGSGRGAEHAAHILLMLCREQRWHCQGTSIVNKPQQLR